jgi:hypothetical protein
MMMMNEFHISFCEWFERFKLRQLVRAFGMVFLGSKGIRSHVKPVEVEHDDFDCFSLLFRKMAYE